VTPGHRGPVASALPPSTHPWSRSWEMKKVLGVGQCILLKTWGRGAVVNIIIP
jgi:hypothetical protein